MTAALRGGERPARGLYQRVRAVCDVSLMLAKWEAVSMVCKRVGTASIS